LNYVGRKKEIPTMSFIFLGWPNLPPKFDIELLSSPTQHKIIIMSKGGDVVGCIFEVECSVGGLYNYYIIFVFSASANVRKKWGYERKLLTDVLIVIHRVFLFSFHYFTQKVWYGNYSVINNDWVCWQWNNWKYWWFLSSNCHWPRTDRIF
jgi:hypothetical protein